MRELRIIERLVERRKRIKRDDNEVVGVRGLGLKVLAYAVNDYLEGQDLDGNAGRFVRGEGDAGEILELWCGLAGVDRELFIECVERMRGEYMDWHRGVRRG